jgi:hypothetical protein
MHIRAVNPSSGHVNKRCKCQPTQCELTFNSRGWGETRKRPEACLLLDGTDEDWEYTEVMGAERQQAVPGAEPRTAL